jgi:hypothetical protein
MFTFVAAENENKGKSSMNMNRGGQAWGIYMYRTAITLLHSFVVF